MAAGNVTFQSWRPCAEQWALVYFVISLLDVLVEFVTGLWQTEHLFPERQRIDTPLHAYCTGSGTLSHRQATQRQSKQRRHSIQSHQTIQTVDCDSILRKARWTIKNAAESGSSRSTA